MITHVVEWFVRAALMALGTAAVLRLLRIRGAVACHMAWTVVLAFMLLMPVWTAWGPKVAMPVVPEAGLSTFDPILPENISLQPLAATATPSVAAPQPLSAPASPEPPSGWPWLWIALGCYAAVATAMLARLAAGTLRARAIIRRATADDGVLTSLDCAVPVTVGWLHPVIVLPPNWRDWPAGELDAVLVHEREHVRRRDPLVQWLALLNRALFWFHPLAWWLERKLAALAEDACDAAVLRRGHDPRAYSEYLIDLARAVRRAGARVPVWGAAIDGGGLAARIKRILSGGPAPRLSRRRATAAAALCGLALAVFGACRLERAQKAAPGQPSMNEIEKRSAAERMKKAAEGEALLAEAKAMTPQQAAQKVESLKANPQDQRLHNQLMRYYEFHSDVKGQSSLILWYIEHQPGGKVWAWNINPGWDRAGYEQGKRLWLANVKAPGATVEIYDRAARFLQGPDYPLAEEILLAGRKAYPDDRNLLRALGEHYALALLGAEEPRTEYNVIRSTNPNEAQGPYASSVRAKLEKSTDSRMLAFTAQGLTMWGHGNNGISPEALALAESYAAKAVSLDPASELAKNIALRVQTYKEYARLNGLQKLPPEEQKRLGDADRLRLVESEMNKAWGPTFKTPDLELTAQKAREVVEIAKRIPGDPHSSYAAFQANLTLGKVALRKGDKREAARFLLAAADVPESEELRLGFTSMNLARALVDWGDRETAAQFLERLAPKTARTKQLQDWAAQIRKGINPELLPIMAGCGQEPC